MKFTTSISSGVHISISEYLSPICAFKAIDELTSVMLCFWYLEFSITLFLSLCPRTYVLDTVLFKLLSFSMFETVKPASFVNHIIRLPHKFYHSVAISFVVPKLSRVDIPARHLFVAPSWFFSFSGLIDHPASVVKLALIVPDNGSGVIKSETDTVFVFFDIQSSCPLRLNIDSELFESGLGKSSQFLLSAVLGWSLSAKFNKISLYALSKKGLEL